jgi:hypothetical protein
MKFIMSCLLNCIGNSNIFGRSVPYLQQFKPSIGQDSIPDPASKALTAGFYI